MAKKARPEKIGPQRRAFALRADDFSLDKNARTMRISFSSEEPVEMWYGTEILDHSAGAMRTDGARQESMPLLFNHNMDDLLGIVESVEIQKKRGYAQVRFGKDPRGDWAMAQVEDGILVNSSFLYRVYEWVEDVEEDTLTATDWEPYELSLVTVPADPSVGVGRASSDAENPVSISQRAIERTGAMTMSEAAAASAVEKGAAPAAASIDLNEVRREAAEGERKRVSEISGLAARFGLGEAFVEEHRVKGSTIEQARASALDAVDSQRKNADGIAAGERARVTEIEAIGKRFNLPREFVEKHATGKTSIENVRGLALEYLSARGEQKPLSSAVVDMTAREASKYSIRAAILAAASNDWKEAGFEREVSGEIQKKRGLSPQSGASFFMPTNLPFQVNGAPRSRLLNQRAIYQVGTAAQGGNLVEAELLASDFIEVLRNLTVTGQLGARYLAGLVANINIPRQNAQTATYWVGESVALTEAEATFDQVQLRPHVVGALSNMSRLTLQQTTPAIEQLVREDLLEVSALALDAAALYGTGSSAQPTGIANTTNVGSVVGGTNGANWTFDFMVNLYAAPLVANAPQANLAFALNAKTKGYLATLKSTTGSYLWQPGRSVSKEIPDEIVGYRYAVSNQLPWNLTKGTSSGICSMAMFGNWQELIIGEWGVTEIMVNPYDSTGFTTGDIVIRAFQTVDVGLRHPASFAVMSDGLTPGF